MAFIKLEGIVNKPLGDKGFIVLETIRLNDGRTFDRKWKVWATPIQPASAFVEVVGELSTKINEYEYAGETKRTIDHNVNAPTVKVLRPATEPTVDVQPDNWGTAPSNEPAPF